MTSKDFEMLARHIGNALAFVDTLGPEAFEAFYDQVYVPLADDLAASNPRFDRMRFGYAVATVRNSKGK
jgi:hypothetical protein